MMAIVAIVGAGFMGTATAYPWRTTATQSVWWARTWTETSSGAARISTTIHD
jgi:predicted dinucleotide-binding enzyme